MLLPLNMVNRLPLFQKTPLRVIVAADTGMLVHMPLDCLLTSAMRNSNDNISSARLGIHSDFRWTSGETGKD
jgi:hypothetical protein